MVFNVDQVTGRNDTHVFFKIANICVELREIYSTIFAVYLRKINIDQFILGCITMIKYLNVILFMINITK